MTALHSSTSTFQTLLRYLLLPAFLVKPLQFDWRVWSAHAATFLYSPIRGDLLQLSPAYSLRCGPPIPE